MSSAVNLNVSDIIGRTDRTQYWTVIELPKPGWARLEETVLGDSGRPVKTGLRSLLDMRDFDRCYRVVELPLRTN